jgi:hypothetical protein
MFVRNRLAVIMVAACALSSCSSGPTALGLAQDALEAMGGAEKLRSIKTLSMKGGTGTRLRLGQSFELYAIAGSPHVEPMVLGYASSARSLFQPDLYTPPSTMPAGPPAVHLSQSIKDLNLKVDTMVGGHGGVGKYADFLKAAVPAPSSN